MSLFPTLETLACCVGKLATRISALEGGSGGGGFTPPAGTVLWLKADAIPVANGAKVLTWPDSSGGGNDMVQVDPAKAPVLAANSINGLPTVHFEEALTNEMAGNPPAPFPWVVCSVMKILNGGAVAYTDQGGIWLGVGVPPTNLYGSIAGAVIVTGYNIVSHYTYDLNEVLRVNGALKEDAFVGEPLPPSGSFKLGVFASSPWLQGDIAEIIIFPGSQSAQIPAVEAYLSGKYGIPLVP